MLQFIVRKVFAYVVLLVIFSFTMYVIIRIASSGLLNYYLELNVMRDINTPPDVINKWRQAYMLNNGIFEDYVEWIKYFFKGDFGYSYLFQKDISVIFKEKSITTFIIVAFAYVLHVFIAIPLAIQAAINKNRIVDFVISSFALLSFSLPVFFIGFLLQKIFAIDLKLLPLQGMVTARYDYTGLALVVDKFRHYILPVFACALGSFGSLLKYSRTSLIEVLSEDFIRTARAKGLSEKRVIYKHALRNAMIPIITQMGISMPYLFGITFLVEISFSIDGINSAAYRAIEHGEIHFTMIYILFYGIISVACLLISDILYAVVNPKLKSLHES